MSPASIVHQFVSIFVLGVWLSKINLSESANFFYKLFSCNFEFCEGRRVYACSKFVLTFLRIPNNENVIINIFKQGWLSPIIAKKIIWRKKENSTVIYLHVLCSCTNELSKLNIRIRYTMGREILPNNLS